MINPTRILELSHVLQPYTEEYQLEVDNKPVREMMPFYSDKVPKDKWYIMSEIRLWSHTGTHIESPYHYIQDGADISQIPLERIAGQAVVIDFTDKGHMEEITREELMTRGGDIQAGDIVLIHTAFAHYYHTDKSHDRPYLAEDAVHWLVEKKIACLGIDASGIENRNQPKQPNHYTLFSNNIPLIEHLVNLDKLTQRRFFLTAVPLRVKGLDAWPITVLAFES
jgi:arylformamidase